MFTESSKTAARGYAANANATIAVFNRGGQIDMFSALLMLDYGKAQGWVLVAMVDPDGTIYEF